MKIAVYSGSFNPIHKGHIAIARQVIRQGYAQQVWLIVSPQNPLKSPMELWPEADRFKMVQLATENEPGLIASDFEFTLPRPSYTIDTLAALREQFPEHDFTLLVGGDNLDLFHRWRDHKRILNEFGLMVYPRPGYENQATFDHPNIKRINAPFLEISSTEIRNRLANNLSLSELMPEAAAAYLRTLH